MAKAPHAPRNSTLPGGISRLGRAAVYGKRALYKRKKVAKKPTAKDAPTTKVKQVGGDKNGKQRTVPLTKESRFYPTEDVKRPLRHRKTPRPTKLRSTLTPGTVVILLAGRHRGKVSLLLLYLYYYIWGAVTNDALSIINLRVQPDSGPQLSHTYN